MNKKFYFTVGTAMFTILNIGHFVPHNMSGDNWQIVLGCALLAINVELIHSVYKRFYK